MAPKLSLGFSAHAFHGLVLARPRAVHLYKIDRSSVNHVRRKPAERVLNDLFYIERSSRYLLG
jgi:hypothetical protein